MTSQRRGEDCIAPSDIVNKFSRNGLQEESELNIAQMARVIHDNLVKKAELFSCRVTGTTPSLRAEEQEQHLYVHSKGDRVGKRNEEAGSISPYMLVVPLHL